MRRSAIAVSLACAVLAGPVEAQRLYFTAGNDSVLSVLTGDTGVAELRVSATGGVSSYDITIFLDDSRVQLIRADSTPGYGLPSPTITAGSGQVNLAATGSGTTSSSFIVARLYFEMNAGAQSGSLLSMKVNTLTAGDGSTDLLPTIRTDVWDVCQAEKMWGDLDGSREVNSRDALIAITSAVGLPVSGFDLQMGDVDEDRVTTTRDALFILSYGVGLSSVARVGRARANHCAPLAPWPNDVAYWGFSNELLYVAAGDTIPQIVPFSQNGSTGYSPSWAPDGSRLVLVKYIGTPYYYYDLVTTTLDGSDQDTLFVSPSDGDWAPAWSPDGTRIAFVRYASPLYSLFVMNADGTNQIRLTGNTFADSIYVNTSQIAWSPDGTKIAFTGYHVSVGGSYSLWTINADGTGVDSVTATSVSAYDPTFSPAGDSLVYDYTNTSRAYLIQTAADTSLTGAPASALYAAQDYPMWLENGIAFLSYRDYPYEFYVRRATDGRYLPLSRNLNGGYHPRARRPGVYVDVVTVTPSSASLTLPGDTATLAATVSNSDASTNLTAMITWRTRDSLIATVDSATGLVTAADSGDVYIIGTAGGWRSDSALVSVLTPAAAPQAASRRQR